MCATQPQPTYSFYTTPPKQTVTGAATGAGATTGGGSGLMARLRRWNIINKSEDCEPDDGAAIGHEAGKSGAGAGAVTRALQIKALKVRTWGSSC